MFENKKFIILSFLIFANMGFLSINSLVVAVEPATLPTQDWAKTWGAVNDDDIIEGIDVESSTGYIYLAGSTNKSGTDYDILLLKYDSDGSKLWETIYDMGANEYGEDVAVDQETGDVYVVGATMTTFSNANLTVVRFNSAGQYLWNLTIDSGGGHDWGYGVDVDSTNCVVFTGLFNDDNLKIARYTTQKMEKFDNQWGGAFLQIGYDVIVDENDDIYVTGQDNGPPESHVVLKFNITGDLQWFVHSSSGGPSSGYFGYGIALDSQGYIYSTGKTSQQPDNELLLAKFEDQGTSGNEKFIKKWTEQNADQRGEDIYIDAEDVIYMAVHRDTSNTSFVITETNISGLNPKNETWDGGTNNVKFARALIMDESKNLYIAGITATGPSNENDILLIKIFTPETILEPPDDPLMIILIVAIIIVGAGIAVAIGIYMRKVKKEK